MIRAQDSELRELGLGSGGRRLRRTRINTAVTLKSGIYECASYIDVRSSLRTVGKANKMLSAHSIYNPI